MVTKEMDVGTGAGAGKQVDLVVFPPGDPADPRNWSGGRKVGIVAILCCLSFCSVFGSSSYAPGELQIRALYHVNADVASTGLTVYVLGFALGPLLWGPLSEMYGRRIPYMISWPLLIAVIAPSAWVENIVVILIFRLLTGCAAACALNNGFGVIADLYGHSPQSLQKAVGFYAFCPLTGPIFGSVVGFFVAAHSGRGLWVVRVHWFFAIALWPLVFLLPETHGPTILTHRARRLRALFRKGAAGGSERAYATHELEAATKMELWRGHIGRPAGMLVWEPINQGAALWISLAYGIVYFFFEAYPVVFVQQKGVPFQLGGLPFLGIVVGMTIALLTMPLATRASRRVRLPLVEPRGGTPVDSPEAALKVALLGCPLMPIALFWFAWTSKGNTGWVAPTLAGIPFGYSMLTVFYSFSGYVTGTYKIYASSAQATNTFVRSLLASIFPIIAHPLIGNLGTEWGVSLFAFLSLGLLPIPIIFVRYGPSLRAKSRYAREAVEVIAHMHQREKTHLGAGGLRDSASTAASGSGVGADADKEAGGRSVRSSRSDIPLHDMSMAEKGITEPSAPAAT